MDDFTRQSMKEHGDDIASTVAGYRSYMSDALVFTKKAFNDEDSILLELENTNITKLDINRLSRYMVYVYPVTIETL